MGILRAVILSGNQLTGETRAVDMAFHALENTNPFHEQLL